MPAPPTPATPRNIISIIIFWESPQPRDASSNTIIQNSNIVFFPKISDSVPYKGCNAVDVNIYDVATHVIMDRELKFCAIVGMAVDTIVLSSDARNIAVPNPNTITANDFEDGCSAFSPVFSSTSP